MKKQYPLDKQQSYLLTHNRQFKSINQDNSSSKLEWSSLQYFIAIIAIGALGGLMIGLFYSLFLGLKQGLSLGLVHGLISGGIWSILWLLKWGE